MKKKYKNIKKTLVFLIIILVFIGFIIFIYLKSKNDGMEQTKGISIYYRTYTSEQGWSKWSKNGLTSGNVDDNYIIKNIQIKIKGSKESEFVYDIYNDKKGWLTEFDDSSSFKNQKINAIRIENLGVFRRRYDVCYRTFNKKNGWLEWSKNGEINGNKTENISGIQIKIVPGNVILREYLKDYKNNENSSSIEFD